jgi:cellulose synthase/poly-beta-1,6-N-acetylglucosamine synthase-like glycosyltransferase
MGTMTLSAVDALIALLSLPALVCTGYLFFLTIFSRRLRPPPPGASDIRFDVIIPAHNEESGIASTVESLLAVDYPRELFRVLVVADNCNDRTAAVAEAAGAQVLVRNDAARRGKGFALAHGFDCALKEDVSDAIIVVDADTDVAPNLLAAFAVRFARGAPAVQAEYGVSNPRASWRTRLMVLALALFHVLRSLARERLRLSAGLRGNGMGFSKEVLAAVPHDAFSIVEDVEYAIRLGLSGHRVEYVAETCVYGEMVASERASRSQRRRWEGGRFELARRRGLPLLREAMRRRDGVLLDLAMDLLVPPLTWIALASLVGTVVSAWWSFDHTGAWKAAIPWVASVAFIVVYVMRGLVLARTGLRGLLDLMWAPVYMGWKVALAVSGRAGKKGEWIRTTRSKEDSRG